MATLEQVERGKRSIDASREFAGVIVSWQGLTEEQKRSSRTIEKLVDDSEAALNGLPAEVRSSYLNMLPYQLKMRLIVDGNDSVSRRSALAVSSTVLG